MSWSPTRYPPNNIQMALRNSQLEWCTAVGVPVIDVQVGGVLLWDGSSRGEGGRRTCTITLHTEPQQVPTRRSFLSYENTLPELCLE